MNAWLVFDLDGTLVDSLPGIAEGLNRALLYVGRQPLAPQAVRGMIGRGAANLCASALGYADASLAPAADQEALFRAFCREYSRCWRGKGMSTAFPGVDSMLARLVAAGAQVAVLSNKPHDVTEPMVRELFPLFPLPRCWGIPGSSRASPTLPLCCILLSSGVFHPLS